MQIKLEYPKLKQPERAEFLSFSSSTLQKHRNDVNMLSIYRIQPNITNKRSKKTFQIKPSITSHIAKMTLKDLKWPQMTSKRRQTNQLNLGKTN